jgi:putative FmdB family regulatory protein
MAIYSYKCLDCSHVFDIEASIEEKETNSADKFFCPKCNSHNIKQEFSFVNFLKSAFKTKSSSSCCS